jgi:hypothetical protein
MRGLIAAIALGLIGLATVSLLHAATYSLNNEAESGTVNGNASVTDSSGASGNTSVIFGLTAPYNVKAVSGGDSIALIWDMASIGIQRVEIFRNNTQVGTVTPGIGILHEDITATRYIDKAVVINATYQYKVRVVGTNGAVSAFSAPVSATRPSNTTPVPTITIDSSIAPDTADYLNTYIVPEIKTWYPKISDALAYPDYTPRPDIHLVVTNLSDAALRTTFATGLIRIDATWLRQHMDGAGAFLHELTHVVQGYENSSPPGWLIEGLADWTREWLTRERYHIWSPLPLDTLGTYSPGSYTLQWAETKSPGIIRKLNVAAHNGTYNVNLLTTATSKTDEQLFTEAKQQHQGPIGAISGINNLCLDIQNANPANGAILQVAGCSNTSQQKWQIIYTDAGNNGNTKLRFDIINTAIGANVQRCLDVKDGVTADNTTVRPWDCNRSTAQEWQRGPNNSIVNTLSGKCLTTASNSGSAGAQLIISACNGSASQQWSLP